MSIPRIIVPSQAARLMHDEGAVLVDVRESDEHALLRIPGARNLPLSRLDQVALAVTPGTTVIFHCRTAARTEVNGARLLARVPGCHVCIVEGGLDGWRATGLPVVEAEGRPIDLARQGQIAVGSLLVATEALGLFVSPWFHLVVVAVGAFLVFGGLTGQVGVVQLLRQMPWNRRFQSVLSARA
jgi:rhodanese-related sulfurtransferase